MGPTIRSASLVDYPEIARSVGLDPYKMLERVGLARSCLRNPDLRISTDAVAELLEASASAARVDDYLSALLKLLRVSAICNGSAMFSRELRLSPTELMGLRRLVGWQDLSPIS